MLIIICTTALYKSKLPFPLPDLNHIHILKHICPLCKDEGHSLLSPAAKKKVLVLGEPAPLTWWQPRLRRKRHSWSGSKGQRHHTGTPRRADWKLIKNASVGWMTGRFCWLSALTKKAGRSRVPGCWRAPGGLHHCLAAKLLPYQRQHINEAAVFCLQMVITTSTFWCTKKKKSNFSQEQGALGRRVDI